MVSLFFPLSTHSDPPFLKCFSSIQKSTGQLWLQSWITQDSIFLIKRVSFSSSLSSRRCRKIHSPSKRSWPIGRIFLAKSRSCASLLLLLQRFWHLLQPLRSNTLMAFQVLLYLFYSFVYRSNCCDHSCFWSSLYQSNRWMQQTAKMSPLPITLGSRLIYWKRCSAFQRQSTILLWEACSINLSSIAQKYY